MTDKKEVLALIPARGNSKSIPRKNIRDLGGYPLIAYSIAAGLQAQCVTRTIVSTDNAEIAEIARAYGAETPFLRPEEFSRDDTQDLPVFRHALKWLAENEDYHPDVVVQLRPTSPFRPPEMLDAAVKLLLEHPGADSVRGVVPSGQNPYKMWRVEADGSIRPLLAVDGIKEAFNAPRQQLPDTYWQTGHIDAIRPRAILEKESMSGDTIMPLFIDSRYTVDIDSQSDWIKYQRLVLEGNLEMVDPGPHKRPFPQKVELLVMDFDGVLTDNRVWVDEQGHESVASNRSDSLGLNNLRAQTKVQTLVISKEVNLVVTARCSKIKLECLQAVDDKPALLAKVMKERGIDPEHVIYMGNDTNDLPCFPLVGYAVAPADAHPEVLLGVDHVTSLSGGRGAVRELCDLILDKVK